MITPSTCLLCALPILGGRLKPRITVKLAVSYRNDRTVGHFHVECWERVVGALPDIEQGMSTHWEDAWLAHSKGYSVSPLG